MKLASLLRVGGLAALLASHAALTQAQQAQQATVGAPTLSLGVQADATIPIKGVVNMDAAGGGAGGMMYPAPNLIGLMVAVATHGVLADSAQRAERARIEAEADKVAVSYRAASAGFRHQHLLQSVSAMPGSLASGAPLVSATHVPQDHPVLLASPVYSVSQDERGLVLDAAMEWRRPGQTEPVTMQARAVTQPLEAGDAGKAWLQEGGARFRQEAATLLAHAIDASFRQLSASSATSSPAEQQTVRYWVGGTKRIERAAPLPSGCGYRAYRTLRGEILVVSSGTTDGCQPLAASEQR